MTFAPASHVRNPDKYYNRTVQDWHMTTLPRRSTAIDIDLYGYCPRCYEPLYLIEAAETGAKPTSVIERLAVRSGAAALLIVHDGSAITRARQLTPKRGQWCDDSDRLRTFLERIRTLHALTAHGVEQ